MIYRWALGCIGCVILVWLTKGAEGVKKFAEDRKHLDTTTPAMKTTVSSFYGDRVLNPAVEELLSHSETAGGLSGKVASILRKMLNYEEDGRATANEARTLFQEANPVVPTVDQLEMQITTSSSPEVNIYQNAPPRRIRLT